MRDRRVMETRRAILPALTGVALVVANPVAEWADIASVTLKVRVPLAIRKRGRRKLVVAADRTHEARPSRPTGEDCLLTAIARAYRWYAPLRKRRILVHQ